jgi:hypothetical protein
MTAANYLKAIGNAAVPVSKVIAQVRPILTPEQQERISNFRMSADRIAENIRDSCYKTQFPD